MKIKVAYCKYVRKDGSVNSCAIDTEKKTYTNHSYAKLDVFIEAAVSKDVDSFRKAIKADGYTLCDGDFLEGDVS